MKNRKRRADVKYTKAEVLKAIKGSGSLTDAALRLAKIKGDSEPVSHQRMSQLKKELGIVLPKRRW